MIHAETTSLPPSFPSVASARRPYANALMTLLYMMIAATAYYVPGYNTRTLAYRHRHSAHRRQVCYL